MAVNSSDLVIIERAGVQYRTTAGEVGALGGGGGGGGATGGNALINFGSGSGGGVASIAITGQSGIASGSRVKAWIRVADTADHNADAHALIFGSRIGITAGNIVAGVGFTIYAETELRLTGDVAVSWEWI